MNSSEQDSYQAEHTLLGICTGRSYQYASIRVAGSRYVLTMEDDTTFIAGESLTDLESALDHLKICDLPCGCLGFSGTVPKLLSQSLERALKTLDAELSQCKDERGFEYHGTGSVRELLVRLGRAQVADS